MPSIWQILGWLLLIVLFVIGIWYKQYQRSGKAGEKNTLRIIKNFLKDNNYRKDDYLLVSNLILQRENYWSCEIDILLLTRKWVYIIEVKDWQVGTLRGNFNDEYLELSWKIRRRRRLWRQRVYSPFYQNETHIKRLKSYFSFNNSNVLGIVVFNSPNLVYNLKRNKKVVLENKFTLANNSIGRGVADVLARYESQNTQLTSFEILKEKISKEIINPDKSQEHRAWSKSVKAGKIERT